MKYFREYFWWTGNQFTYGGSFTSSNRVSYFYPLPVDRGVGVYDTAVRAISYHRIIR